MKKSMISAIIIMTIIVLMAAFDFSLSGTTPAPIPESVLDGSLFVCPAKSAFWAAMAAGFGGYSRYFLMGFLFAAIILMFMWGWALYQNLLKDEFKKDMFSKPWAFTKLLFWACVIIMLVINTPNHYRSVAVSGRSGDWVLCESTSDGAVAVPADLVHSK